MPSGCPVVQLHGNALASILGLSPPSFCVSTFLYCRPLRSFSAPLPIGAVYVGAGCKVFPVKPSVWLNPFDFVACEGSSLDVYYEAALLRPNLRNWLAPLATAQVLVCDCLSADCSCHARVLLRLLSMFGSVSQPVSAPCSDEEMLCPECEPDEADDEILVSSSHAWNINETLRGSLESSVVRGVGYPESWQKLISRVRSAPQRIFWELFAGCAVLISMFLEQGWCCGPPIDVVADESYNLLDAFFVSVVIGLILEGRVMLLHLGPPCSSFSWAVNKWPRYAMRSLEFPGGLPNLPKYREEKVRLGNALALVSIRNIPTTKVSEPPPHTKRNLNSITRLGCQHIINTVDQGQKEQTRANMSTPIRNSTKVCWRQSAPEQLSTSPSKDLLIMFR